MGGRRGWRQAGRGGAGTAGRVEATRVEQAQSPVAEEDED